MFRICGGSEGKDHSHPPDRQQHHNDAFIGGAGHAQITDWSCARRGLIRATHAETPETEPPASFGPSGVARIESVEQIPPAGRFGLALGELPAGRPAVPLIRPPWCERSFTTRAQTAPRKRAHALCCTIEHRPCHACHPPNNVGTRGRAISAASTTSGSVSLTVAAGTGSSMDHFGSDFPPRSSVALSFRVTA